MARNRPIVHQELFFFQKYQSLPEQQTLIITISYYHHIRTNCIVKIVFSILIQKLEFLMTFI